ncbi:hypothetical protein VSR68_37900 [Paraburkholderia phymatum]|uniref:hypothetical protein n=1 Tax=Paraburkholderia phymatum TaxID=148447 RepID=UPI00316C2633
MIKKLSSLILSASLIAGATIISAHAAPPHDWETVIWKKGDKEIQIDRSTLKQTGQVDQDGWHVIVWERERNLALQDAMQDPRMKDAKDLERVTYITTLLIDFDCWHSTETTLAGQWVNIRNGVVMKLDNPTNPFDTRKDADLLSVQHAVCKD